MLIRQAKSSSSSTRAPERVAPRDLPPQPAVFAADYAPEELAEIAKKLRQRAGLPKERTGVAGSSGAQTTRAKTKPRSRTRTSGKR